MPTDLSRQERARAIELWIARVRLAAVVFAVLEVAVFSKHYPAGYERLAWIATAVLWVAVALTLVTGVQYLLDGRRTQRAL